MDLLLNDQQPVCWEKIFLPLRNGQPMVAKLANSPTRYVLVFSSEEKFHAHLRLHHQGQPYYEKQHILQPDRFCAAIWRKGYQIMLDPVSYVNDEITRYGLIIKR